VASADGIVVRSYYLKAQPRSEILAKGAPWPADGKAVPDREDPFTKAGWNEVLDSKIDLGTLLDLPPWTQPPVIGTLRNQGGH
jgi:hypothetical protein